MLNKRTNILFDERLWNKLTELAEDKNTSIGELVRSAVKKQYLSGDEELARIKDACESIEKRRKRQKGKVDYKALINYGRKI